jgi:hypothetical protein
MRPAIHASRLTPTAAVTARPRVARSATWHPAEWHELTSRPEVIIATLLDMTSYQPAAAPRISPATLATAGVLTVVLSVAMIFGGSALFGASAYGAVVVTIASSLGRFLFIAGIVLVVLSVVRRLDRR